MKKIRESFHRIAAAVFYLIMSMKAGLFPGMGQAVMAGTENKKYVSGIEQNINRCKKNCKHKIPPFDLN